MLSKEITKIINNLITFLKLKHLFIIKPGYNYFKKN